jgi:putative membrane protein
LYTRFTITNIRTYVYLIKEVVFVTLYSALVYILYEFYGHHHLTISFSISAVMGTAIAILLGFRTSAAYERWWEARKIWGGLVNDSRTLIRQANGFIDSGEQKELDVRKLAKYQIAFNYALSTSLRKLPLSDEVKKNLSESDYSNIHNHLNIPNAILKLMEDHLAALFRKGRINAYHFGVVDQTLKSICDNMGKCERIKGTVFPVHYGFFIRLSIIIFALLLPLEIVEFLGVLTIPVTFVTIIFISVIESIANYLQDPFENRAADIGTTTICRIIEINLLQMTDEKNVPNAIPPDNKGIVW